ncbi:MAG: hypothetical protein IJ685_08365 [Selenomonadaceae bacterium]|nr:hypothetical protein [Selenomonadaceae bacterium]
MQDIDQDFFDFSNIDNFRPPEEEFPDICCRECKYSSWNVQRNAFQCARYRFLVRGEDSCDEAET